MKVYTVHTQYTQYTQYTPYTQYTEHTQYTQYTQYTVHTPTNLSVNIKRINRSLSHVTKAGGKKGLNYLNLYLKGNTILKPFVLWEAGEKLKYSEYQKTLDLEDDLGIFNGIYKQNRKSFN